MKEMSLNENEIRTILGIFNELSRKSYDELNTYLGSITIVEMLELTKKINDWYQPEVLNKTYDSELGWVDPYTIF